MACAVVFAFAVADGLPPVAGAAPYEVLARQLPRLLVARLNANGDRGVRFFPFLGPVDGQRAFLRVNEFFDPQVLGKLHKQGDVQLLSDGRLERGRLRWRILDGRSLEVQREFDLPFDPTHPLDVLARFEFELADRLGWTGRPQAPPPLRGEAMGWFLVLKDELLRREANLPIVAPEPLRAARRCVELSPCCPDVQHLVLEFAAQALRRGEPREPIAAVLAAMTPSVGDDPALLERTAALLFAAGDADAAATTLMRAVLLAPDRADLVERTAAQLFRLDRFAEVRAVVGRARQVGSVSPGALAQLAAACDRTGDDATRAAIVQELVGMPDLPIPVARLVVSFLLEEEQPSVAKMIVERALAKEPDHAGLHFERARACLLLDDGDAAGAALQRALQLGLQPALADQARRLLRLASVPGLWHDTQAIEKSMAAGDLAGALAAARALVRRVSRVAEAWFLLGIVTHKLGHGRRAERALRHAIRLDAEFSEAHNRLGVLLLSSGRLEDGERHLMRAHQISPHDPSPRLHLAQALAMRGQLEAADGHVTAAERLGADANIVDAVRREIMARRE